MTQNTAKKIIERAHRIQRKQTNSIVHIADEKETEQQQQQHKTKCGTTVYNSFAITEAQWQQQQQNKHAGYL